jgi:hypothetical protein
MFTFRKKGSPAFQKTLGVLQRAYIMQPLGVLQGVFRPQKPKVLATLKNP